MYLNAIVVWSLWKQKYIFHSYDDYAKQILSKRIIVLQIIWSASVNKIMYRYVFLQDKFKQSYCR